MDPATAITLALGLLDRAAQWAQAANKAKAEGRDISEAELDGLAKGDDAARAALEAAIATAK